MNSKSAFLFSLSSNAIRSAIELNYHEITRDQKTLKLIALIEEDESSGVSTANIYYIQTYIEFPFLEKHNVVTSDIRTRNVLSIKNH